MVDEWWYDDCGDLRQTNKNLDSETNLYYK